MLTAKSHN